MTKLFKIHHDEIKTVTRDGIEIGRRQLVCCNVCKESLSAYGSIELVLIDEFEWIENMIYFVHPECKALFEVGLYSYV